MILPLLLWWLLPAPDPAPYRLFACGITSRGWVVGMKLPPSGLFLSSPQGWRHLGYVHPAIDALDYDPRDPRVLYLAAGNGCIRSTDAGATWRITTSWDMTELKDVSVDRNRPDTVWVALPDGIGVTRDAGRSWTWRGPVTPRKFTQTILVDRTQPGRVLAGGEAGLFLSGDDGATWRRVLDGAQVSDIAQSPHNPAEWMAATQDAGLWTSRDQGERWTRVPAFPPGVVYNIAYDASTPGRIAVAGWGFGVIVSVDGGRRWVSRAAGLPSPNVWRAAFDPAQPGRLLAGVHEEALFVSLDSGATWRSAGLPGSIVNDLVFVPEPRR